MCVQVIDRGDSCSLICCCEVFMCLFLLVIYTHLLTLLLYLSYILQNLRVQFEANLPFL